MELPATNLRSHFNNPEEAKTALLREFPDVLTDEAMPGVMNGPDMRIHLDNSMDVRPHAERVARQVPVNLRRQADNIVKEMLAKGIISAVVWMANRCW